MNMTVDARGDACPIPVVKAKQALATFEEGTVEVLVDNETAVKNLEALAASLNMGAESAQRAENEYAVVITKDENAVMEEAPAAGSSKKVVVISSNVMGGGDDALGATLMKGFIFALTQQDVLPDTVLMYNGGVKMACEDSPALDDLKALAEAGVEIFSCGTCLKNYGLEEKLAVGEVTNMYVIVEKQIKAGTILRP